MAMALFMTSLSSFIHLLLIINYTIFNCFLQADIATLMASLIGVPIPVNSVVSPDRGLNVFHEF